MDTELRPTLWRTARALANAERLRLFRRIVEADEAPGVVALADAVHLAPSTVSAYLRSLNARGLVGVDRKAAFVFYNLRTDRSLPVAAAVQRALRDRVRSTPLPDDWTDAPVRLFRAFAHPRRLLLLRLLLAAQELDDDALRAQSGLCPSALQRHLAVLLRSDVVWSSNHGTYFLHRPFNPLAAPFLAALERT